MYHVRISVRANVYIIAGPNGAGKTTFARKFLPKYRNSPLFVNADLIAQGLSPFSPEAAAFRAGRIVLEEITALARRRLDFAFETTLSGRGYLKLMRHLRERGYTIHIFFLYISDEETAIARICERVLKGGHNVPENEIRRRFNRSLSNFFSLYSKHVDQWMLFDNSGPQPQVIASSEHGEVQVESPELFERLIQQYERQTH